MSVTAARRVSRQRAAVPPPPVEAPRLLVTTAARRTQAILDRVREEANGFENKMFGDMFYEAVYRKHTSNDTALFDFVQQLEQPPVDIETFLDSEEFMGATDITLWPEVRKAVIEICRDWWKGPAEAYHEAVLMGATGTGKTEISKIITVYHIHIVGCLRNPQAVYGLPKTTPIIFPIMAAKPHVTKRVVYTPIRSMMEAMPWFQKHMRIDPMIESEIYMAEKNVRVVMGGADSDSILGEATIGGIIDEINFMNVVLKSKKAEVSTGRAGVYDQASAIYEALTRRKKSRFITKGPQVGIICVASSTRYKGDFTDKRKKEVFEQKIKTSYIYDKKQYEVWPQDRYCGETFRLLVGNDVITDTRVLTDDEKVPEGSLVLDVPIEYKSDFLRNPHDSLRDVVGMSTSSISPFFRRRFKILQAIDRGVEDGLKSILFKDNVILGVDGLPRLLPEHYCANPSRPRYVHIDLSISGDRCGIAMVRFDGLQDSVRSAGVTESLPSATIELAVSIEPDSNNEISIAEIRAWVKQLRDIYGYPIKAVTYDGFESKESRQQWKKEGMRAGLVSVDKTSVPYKHLRDAFADDRIRMYPQDVLVDELFSLEFDETKDKVDHPPKGCFTGDTRVALANGTCPTFSELKEQYGSRGVFYVYSMGPEGVRISPARNSRVTRRAAVLVEVLLDNYQVVRCTPDHLFMTLDGDWIRADSLTPDVSIMPLYRNRVSAGGWAGYERVWCPIREERVLTHHLAHGEVVKGSHIHHIDEVKHNNDPRNLEALTHKEHVRKHATERWATTQKAMRTGHALHYAEQSNRDAQASRVSALWASGEFGPRRAPCAVEGCDSVSNARGLCDKHYQQAKRAKTLPERTSKIRNHRVLSVTQVVADEDVYDITVPETENFALASGVFVHNSKDVADAVCGAYFTMLQRRTSWMAAASDDAAKVQDARRAEFDSRYESERTL